MQRRKDSELYPVGDPPAEDAARAARRQARGVWPIVVHRLDDEPDEDLSAVTTPAQRIAMMAELAESAWRIAGKPLPSYDRQNLPGRLFRVGEPRDHDDA